jgi:hypothetical protein
MFTRLLPFAAILISIAAVFFYIRPTFAGAIATNKTQIASYDAALAAASRFTQKEAELTTAAASIPGDSMNRLNAFLPDGVDNIQLILDLNGLAARSGMVLSNFDVGAAPAGAKASGSPTSPPTQTGPSGTNSLPSSGPTVSANGGVDSLDLSLTASGTYQSFRVFLAAIESSLRPLDIKSITVHQSKTGVYMYDITIRIYWLP